LNRDKKIKIKIIFIFIFFVFSGIGIITKLYHLQIKGQGRFNERALNQYKGKVYKYTNRGNIFDRNMRPLAVNVKVKSVYAHPDKIQNHLRTARTVSSVLDLPKKEIRKKLKKKLPFVYIKRKINPDEYNKLKNKNLSGIYFSTEYKRFYPKMELASRTIGFAGMDNQGLSGIEYYFDDYLSHGGKWVRFQKDRRGRNVDLVGNETDHVPEGRNVVLTIDEVLQYHAFKAVKEKVIQKKAKRGIAIIMEPNTGEVLAMAEYPSFNANLSKRYTLQQRKNRAVSDTFEPGSTFKIILASAALEEKVALPKDIFFCEEGVFDIGGILIHEANRKKYRWLTLTEIITKSSNIGAVKIARRLGESKFYEYIKKFGFGEITGINLPGEATGIVRDPSQWTKVSIGSMSIGQEVSSTPLQLVSAVSAIANGGYLIKPTIVKQAVHEGKIIKSFSPEIVRKVLSPETVKIMKEILTRAVIYGTGKNAAIPGYSVGGKTGTAQKIDPDTKRYSANNYVASFVGFVPVENPKLTILVMIDEPRGIYWGGSVAAPVFREIAKKALRHLNVPSGMNRTFTLSTKSDKSNQGRLNAGLEINSVQSNINLKIRKSIDEFLGRVIAGLKNHYWEKDKNA
tara:strand:+ start:5397 stop:7271 length:1875 start_codon:yes stop_codon:yes gene_type:complete